MKTLTKKDVHKGFLILVNADYPVFANSDKNNLMPIAGAGHETLLTNTAAALSRTAMRRLACEGETAAVSRFRSKREQKAICMDSLYENGRGFTGKYAALPGHSEHQIGLAVDMALTGSDIDTLTPDFPYDGICQKFRDAIALYGFIEPCPKGKKYITQIGHEPRHFRYGGVPHAAIMKQNGISLEEYIDLPRGYTFGRKRLRFSDCGRAYEIGFAESKNEITEMSAPDTPMRISGSSAEGFILTKWC